MALTRDDKKQIQQFLQYKIKSLKKDLYQAPGPHGMIHDRDLSLYECVEFMFRKKVSTIQELSLNLRIETLTRYCVEQQQYFSSMQDFFIAVNSFYERIIQAFEEGNLQ